MRKPMETKVDQLAAEIADATPGYEVTVVIRHIEDKKDVWIAQFLPSAEESIFPYWRAAIDAAQEIMLHAAEMRDEAMAEVQTDADGAQSDESAEDEASDA